jgi:4-hydroxy-3-methylbut-2-enyl diphosphate reductase
MPEAALAQVDVISPRSYCAGVDRAIATVEQALERLGAPVYVRGEIVHNRHVVDALAKHGAVFVKSELEVPEGSTIVLSAHGVAPEVREHCAARGLRVIDATCPLVTKVHAEVRRFAKRGATVLLVGHADHEEVIGTSGEAPDHVIIVEDAEQARTVNVPDPDNAAITTQTTLSLDDTAEIIGILQARFPALLQGPKGDICYATQNRQDAVKVAVADGADLVLVVGSKNSSNSNRMVEVGQAAGAEAYLIENANALDTAWLAGKRHIALTAGASAPEELVREVAAVLEGYGFDRTGSETPSREGVYFALPRGKHAPSRETP